MTRIIQTLVVRSLSHLVLAVLMAGVVLFGMTPAQAATPEQACKSAKNKTAGKYAACRQSAEAKLATTGDGTKYGATLTRCGTNLASAWQKAIEKATAAGATCLDDPLVVGDFQTVIDQHTDNVATALGGGSLTDCPADLAACEGDLGTCTTGLAQTTSDLTTCDGDLGTCQSDLVTCQVAPKGQRLKTGQTICYDTLGAVIACAGTGQDGELQKGLVVMHEDNGDGTITDTQTGLMWEKLSGDGSLHDVNMRYTWANAFAVKVAGLNAGSGFAGHTDWRLPNRSELESILNLDALDPTAHAAFNNGWTSGCTIATCSLTSSGIYWSATTHQGGPSFGSFAWGVEFDGGSVAAWSKSNNSYVRGVRGGS